MKWLAISIIFIVAIATTGCVEETTYSDYDINKDGIVNQEDVELVMQHYGETGEPGWIREDVNKDGIINVLDGSLVSSNIEV